MTDVARPRIGLNQALALVALALGVLALFGNPHRGHRVTLDTQELARMVGTEVDHVTPQQLAGWIIEGATDYRLIDLRSPAEFARYHIPTAENVPVAQLPGYGLARNERIVLYSQGGIHAAQGWMLLRALGYQGVYTLFGGLDGWTDEVLYPAPPPGDAAQPRHRVACDQVIEVITPQRMAHHVSR